MFHLPTVIYVCDIVTVALSLSKMSPNLDLKINALGNLFLRCKITRQNGFTMDLQSTNNLGGVFGQECSGMLLVN